MFSSQNVCSPCFPWNFIGVSQTLEQIEALSIVKRSFQHVLWFLSGNIGQIIGLWLETTWTFTSQNMCSHCFPWNVIGVSGTFKQVQALSIVKRSFQPVLWFLIVNIGKIIESLCLIMTWNFIDVFITKHVFSLLPLKFYWFFGNFRTRTSFFNCKKQFSTCALVFECKYRQNHRLIVLDHGLKLHRCFHHKTCVLLASPEILLVFLKL